MKELNSYGLRILGIDTVWARRTSFAKRLILIVGELNEEELYLVKSICFSINANYCKRQMFVVKSLPNWAKNDDIIVDFVGWAPGAENVISLPAPEKILQKPSLKKKIWLDLSKILR